MNESILLALKELIADVKSKPNDTRYATKIKKAEDAIKKWEDSSGKETGKFSVDRISGVATGVCIAEEINGGTYSEQICDTLFDTGNDKKDAAASEKWATIICNALNQSVPPIQGGRNKIKIMKYRKKPVVVEAFKWTVDEVPQWWEDLKGATMNVYTMSAFIPTLEGTMEANKGDYIIQGVNGEVYPCKPDIFEKTYEPYKHTRRKLDYSKNPNLIPSDEDGQWEYIREKLGKWTLNDVIKFCKQEFTIKRKSQPYKEEVDKETKRP